MGHVEWNPDSKVVVEQNTPVMGKRQFGMDDYGEQEENIPRRSDSDFKAGWEDPGPPSRVLSNTSDNMDVEEGESGQRPSFQCNGKEVSDLPTPHTMSSDVPMAPTRSDSSGPIPHLPRPGPYSPSPLHQEEKQVPSTSSLEQLQSSYSNETVGQPPVGQPNDLQYHYRLGLQIQQLLARTVQPMELKRHNQEPLNGFQQQQQGQNREPLNGFQPQQQGQLQQQLHYHEPLDDFQLQQQRLNQESLNGLSPQSLHPQYGKGERHSQVAGHWSATTAATMEVESVSASEDPNKMRSEDFFAVPVPGDPTCLRLPTEQYEQQKRKRRQLNRQSIQPSLPQQLQPHARRRNTFPQAPDTVIPAFHIASAPFNCPSYEPYANDPHPAIQLKVLVASSLKAFGKKKNKEMTVTAYVQDAETRLVYVQDLLYALQTAWIGEKEDGSGYVSYIKPEAYKRDLQWVVYKDWDKRSGPKNNDLGKMSSLNVGLYAAKKEEKQIIDFVTTNFSEDHSELKYLRLRKPDALHLTTLCDEETCTRCITNEKIQEIKNGLYCRAHLRKSGGEMSSQESMDST